MKTLHTLGAILALVIVTAVTGACGGEGAGASTAAPSADLANGEKHFMSTCATCHGKDARGLPQLGKGLRGNEFTAQLSDSELVGFLKTGRPSFHPLNSTGIDMPPKGGNPALGEEDLAAIVTYLRTLK